MLDPQVTEIGVAVAQSQESGNWYGVQMFGRPRSMVHAFEISNFAGEKVRYSIDGRSYSLPPRATRLHERCRPAAIDYGWTEERESLAPEAGAHYVVQRAGDDRLTVSQKTVNER